MTCVYCFLQHAISIFVSESKEEISDFENAISYAHIISESHKFSLGNAERDYFAAYLQCKPILQMTFLS
jgi:hypothetical protein